MNIACAFLILCILTAFPSHAATSDSGRQADNFKILFVANGQVTIGINVYGENAYTDLAPGYRSDMLMYTDLLGYKKLVFSFLSGATTSIARMPETPIKMDKIRYTLCPGFRYPFKKSVIALQFFHECIHTISRDEKSGSTWWNAAQINGGTKGAYPMYLIAKYNNRDFSLRHSFDIMATIGIFLRGHSQWIGRNHTYQSDLSGIARYHLGLFHNQTLFFDIKPHVWYDDNGDITTKLIGEINYVILARGNIATLYYSHCFHDDNPYDNESTLGTVGFKVIF